MEKHIELYFKKRVKEEGGKAIKFTSPGETGMPDRLVLFRFLPGITLYVELKYGRNGLSPRQKYVKKEFKGFGHTIRIAASKEAVEAFIKFAKRLA